MKKLIIAVDYDDTIVDQDFPNSGTLKKNAIKYLNLWKQQGHSVILFTCRNGTPLITALNYLKNNDFIPHEVNQNTQEQIDDYNNRHPNIPISSKVYANVYIDDRGINGLPKSWNKINKIIQKITNE